MATGTAMLGGFPGAGGGSSQQSGLQNMFNNNSSIQPQSSNQYFGNMPSFANPGQASSPYPNPPGGGFFNNQNQAYSTPNNPFNSPTQAYGQNYAQTNVGGGSIHEIQPLYPGLSGNFAGFLNSQIGQGISPYGGSTALPGGGMSAPGSLSAPLNPLLQQLMSMYMGGGSNVPGGNTLNQIANNGISALPEWQSMIQAQQQNIQQNQANLAEQFGGFGDLAGSGFANAMQNYQQGTTATQNALLGQLQQQNINTQIGVGENLSAGANQFGSGLQQLQNQALMQQYQQYQTDAPQNNPLLQEIQGMATLFPPTMKTPSTWEMLNQTIGALTGSGFSTGGGSTGSQTSVSL